MATAAIAVTGLATAVWLPTQFDQAEAAERGELVQVFADEFDGARGGDPDGGKWSEDGRGVQLDGDGNVAILARPGRRERSADAGIQSKQTFSAAAGKVEARVRVADGESVRSVFRLLGADDARLDVLDNRGNRSRVLRAGFGADVTGKLEERDSFAADFHLYAVRWEPGAIVWTVDDKEFLRTEADLTEPFAVSLEVTAGDADRDRSVRRMLIDFVRVSTEQEQPPATEEPPAEQPPSTEPPTEQPPTEEPPTEQPPSSEPPTEQPPTEQPPTEEPPAEEPPAEQPPAIPAWEPFKVLAAGDKVTFDGATYEVLSPHTSLPGWEPTLLPLLFKKI